MRSPSRALARAVVSLLVAIAAAAGYLAIDTDNATIPPAPPPADPAVSADEVPVPAAIAVDGTGDGEPDEVLELDGQAREIVQEATVAPERFDISGGLRGVDPTPEARQDGPLAAPNWPGCETRFLPRNWSNRTSGVQAIGLHYTAGANREGKSDMDGLTAYASSPSAGVSWHFLIDEEGHCYYSVHVSKKAWTIGNLNSQTVNIEVVGTGKERTYPAGSAGARKLAAVVQRIGRVYDIPMRLGAVSNCRVTRPGIITHWQGGACAGGHHDIRPYDIQDVVEAIAASGKSRKLAKWERSHRIAHAMQRSGCRRRQDVAGCRAHYRARSAKLHRLIARERRR